MQLIDHIDKIKNPFDNAVITIGNFDGVHLGHQALFHGVIEKADEIGGTSIVMTFEPHPIRVLKQNGLPPLITLYEQKIELISNTGLDVLICVPFSREFASISANAFVEDLLVRRIGMKAIVVGEDYTFGRNREGDVNLLKTYARRLGFEVILTDWIQISNNGLGRVSSTAVRDLVTTGKVAEARKFLGRYYQIRGKVAPGRNRGGNLLGFPTANINLLDELCPKTGVYAVTIECMNKKYLGVANIGYSPTFGDKKFSVEVHILDFKKNIYGQEIRVNFIERIRDEVKFSNISELSEQIRKDIEKTRGILSL